MPTPSALELIAAAERLGRGEGTVAALLPWLAGQVRADAAAARFADWAQSTVVDEAIAAPVIPRAVFDELHALAGIEADWPVGNAGLLHVYGYLLSTVSTPYGLKRERWTSGAVARAFDLAPQTFAPWFAAPSTQLERILAAALPVLAAPRTPLLWIDERLGDELVRTVVIGGGGGALIYGTGSGQRLRLVTVFPFDVTREGWREALLEGAPRLRYNAVIEGHPTGVALESREVR
jgi:hypothetical protein